MIVLTQAEFNQQMDKLTSIKGIGVSLAAAIIITTGGFNAKQVSRYLGICPTYQQSGTSINVKGHINRNGDSALRSQRLTRLVTSFPNQHRWRLTARACNKHAR